MRTASRTACLAAALLGAAACNGTGTQDSTIRTLDGRPDDEAYHVTEDGTARTVISERPALGLTIEVMPVPTLRIGRAEGREEDLLDQVMAATRLHDGTIVVANSGSGQIRFYDNSARLIASAGGLGEGPGEFRQIMRLWRLPGDTLVALGFPPRLNWFDRDGRFLRMQPVNPVGSGIPHVAGMIGSHRILVAEMRPPGASGTSMLLHWVDRDGDPTGTVTEHPTTPTGPGGLLVGFAPRARLATSHDRLCYGYPAEWEVTCYDPDAVPRLVVRRAHEPIHVSDEVVQTFRTGYLGGPGEAGGTANPGMRQLRESNLRRMQFAGTLPAFSRMLFDDVGRLWVEEYDPREEIPAGIFNRTFDTPTRWSVFSIDGIWLANAITPPHLHVLGIGDGWLLGLHRDAFGVEYVDLYEYATR